MQINVSGLYKPGLVKKMASEGLVMSAHYKGIYFKEKRAQSTPLSVEIKGAFKTFL